MGRYSLGTLAKSCDKFSSENPIFLRQGTTALRSQSFQEAHAGVSTRGRCATDAVLNTFAITVAQNTLPHSVPPANLKHTSSKQAFQTSLHKLVTPIKVDRLNFLLSGYETSLRLYLVNGFTFGFHVGFHGERCTLHSPNLKSVLDQPQIVRTKLRKECEAGRICGPFICPPFPNFICSPLGIVPKKDTARPLVFVTDNAALVSIINQQTSKHKLVMILIRDLVLTTLTYNIIFRGRHISGLNNTRADCLSRFQIARFKELSPQADELPTIVPEILLPKSWSLT